MTSSRDEHPNKVTLLDEHDGPDSWFVGALINSTGDLVIDGQDLGPATAVVRSDGEYAWTVTVPYASLGRAAAVLGGVEGEPILELLARKYGGRAAYGIRQTLEDAGIPVELWTWGG